MKIDNRHDLGSISPAGAKGAAGVEGTGRREAGHGAESTGPDSAELSGLAGKISAATNQAAAHRAEKVEKLRAAVAGGSYHPDPAAISHAIVNDALTGGTPKK